MAGVTVYTFDNRKIVQLPGITTSCQYRRTNDGGLEMREIPDLERADVPDSLWRWTRVPWRTLLWMRVRRKEWNAILQPLGL